MIIEILVAIVLFVVVTNVATLSISLKEISILRKLDKDFDNVIYQSYYNNLGGIHDFTWKDCKVNYWVAEENFSIHGAMSECHVCSFLDNWLFGGIVGMVYYRPVKKKLEKLIEKES